MLVSYCMCKREPYGSVQCCMCVRKGALQVSAILYVCERESFTGQCCVLVCW